MSSSSDDQAAPKSEQKQKQKLSSEEAMKIAQKFAAREHEIENARAQALSSIPTGNASGFDRTRVIGAGGAFNTRSNPTILTHHGMKLFGGALVFCLASIYYFTGMTVVTSNPDGKRICVNCQNQKEIAERRWFSPPPIMEPPQLPNMHKKTKMLN